MGRTAISGGLTIIAFLVAASWTGWVVSQGTNQLIQPGWWAFRYAALLLVALVIALAAVLVVRIKPPANRTAAVAIGVVAGLESLLFGFVWFALVVMPFPP
jgi:hypothetical protein